MARMFRIVVLVLVLWDSQCASGTERTNVTPSTDTIVITRYFTRWEPKYYTLQAVFISGSLEIFATSEISVVEGKQPGVYSSQTNPHRVGIGVVTRLIQ